MPIKVGINGYGRIGRNILRALYEANRQKEIQIVALNDLGDAQTNAYLTRYDSVHGKFPGEVQVEGDALVVNGDRIRVLQRAPAGDVHVTCFGSGSALAGAIATVPQGGRATVRLEVVNRDGTGGSIGVDFADFSFEPRVARLVAGGPAAQAGVAVGDLIVALAGEDVRGLDALSVRGLIRNLPVGGRVALGVQRGSAARRTVQVAVVLEE
jgi:hypothetical protein